MSLDPTSSSFFAQPGEAFSSRPVLLAAPAQDAQIPADQRFFLAARPALDLAFAADGGCSGCMLLRVDETDRGVVTGMTCCGAGGVGLQAAGRLSVWPT
jgi:hypothetical protein